MKTSVHKEETGQTDWQKSFRDRDDANGSPNKAN